MLRASIPTSIEIRQDISSTALVEADPNQMHQIVINLCTNAYQAMPERIGVLSVTLKDITLGDEAVRGNAQQRPTTPNRPLCAFIC